MWIGDLWANENTLGNPQTVTTIAVKNPVKSGPVCHSRLMLFNKIRKNTFVKSKYSFQGCHHNSCMLGNFEV